MGVVFLAAQKKQSNQNANKYLSVLFIGNSYTQPLPPIIQLIARNNGTLINYRSITPGGWTLKKHSQSKVTLEAIREKRWDYIVLQEQSQLPSFAEEQRRKEIYPYADKLVKEIRKASAKPLLFLTWGRKHGDIHNIPDDTRSEMQARLLEGYQNMAKLTSSKIIPVGIAWESVISTKDSDIDLYTHDGSHPNHNGIYLSAAVFVSHLLDSSQLISADLNGLPKETTEFLIRQTNTLEFKLESI
ncbi:DUF4886 domain-containing protein [Microbulbifer sp. GL-2]|uniref:DUF4886 domain-containing protein n=1 Tax=Microbulbifer sp. GL-2 TaxID=2591606 RepID=UPI001164C0DE|nr:DUF4886 domain-containing protein [Microbulbifer sp. GL-2]BBM00111.1 hypothetical protein GL2_01850 [Microbulbifer sp. GL-2]